MEYKVEDTELTLIANAIRSACNLSDELEFPSDFIAKINTLNSAYVGKDESPYLLRQSPTDFGSNYNSEIPTLIGGSIAWNQLVKNGNFADTSEWFPTSNIAFSVASNIATITALASGDYYVRQDAPMITGHKYLILVEAQAVNTDGTREVLRLYYGGSSNYWRIVPSDSNFGNYANIVNCETNQYNFIRLYNGTNTTTNKFRNVMLIDLTATFGTEIADYVYSLEQTTAGSGIAWLKSYGFLTKDYYAYNDGSLVSVKTSEHRTTGKNLLKITVGSQTVNGITFTVNSDGTIKAVGTATARTALALATNASETPLLNKSVIMNGCPSDGSISTYFLQWYGFDGASASVNDIGSGTSAFTPTSTAGSIAIVIQNGVTVDLIFKPMVRLASVSDATFEPYESHSYLLDSDLELRGIPKLSNGNLYYDGDEYTADGTVNRLYRRYTSSTTHTDEYGTLGSGVPYYGIILSNASDKIVSGNTKDMVCNLGYIALGAGETSVSGGFRAYDESEFIFYDTRFTSKAVAQQLLADLEIVYKAKTSTTETADSFTSPQIVSPLGTEEYVDTRSVPVPVGHRTEYDYRREVV